MLTFDEDYCRQDQVGSNVSSQIKEAQRLCHELSLSVTLPSMPRAAEDWGLCCAEEFVKEAEQWVKACRLWASAGLLSSLWGIKKRESGPCEF